jgi:hypothetical protein
MDQADKRKVVRKKYEEWQAEIARWLSGFWERYCKVYGDHGVVVLKKVDKESGRWAGRLIHPSTVQDGYWQSTLFHADGFFGHDTYATLEKALREDYVMGFRAVDPKWADEVVLTPEFIEGERRAEEHMRRWRAQQAEFRKKQEAEHGSLGAGAAGGHGSPYGHPGHDQ